MKIKYLLLYVEWYVLNLPAYLYHEVWHWMFLFVTWIYRLNSFPKMRFERFASWEINANHTGYEQISHHLSVSYVNYYNFKNLNRICAFMPIVGVIVLFMISPKWLWIYYLSQINTLWLSVSDTNMIIHGDHNKINNQ